MRTIVCAMLEKLQNLINRSKKKIIIIKTAPKTPGKNPSKSISRLEVTGSLQNLLPQRSSLVSIEIINWYHPLV